MTTLDFNSIYTRNYQRSFMFVKSYVHDDMVAEDIVAESLFKFWQLCKKSTEEVKEVLLLTILKNASIDHLRREKSKNEAMNQVENIAVRDLEILISSLDACNPQEIFSKEIQQIVQDTLKTLPQQTQDIFIMSRIENLSVKEIAKAKHITTKAVEYHITKTLKVMRISLKDYFPILLFFWS